jgi:glucose-1-phosphate thymidylyltransferase
MKALVLAGGLGTRMRPLTHTMAKQMVPVANKPVLYYGLEAIRDAGITQTVIVVGGRGRQIRDAVGRGDAMGLDVCYIEQVAPLGLAHCVQIARAELGTDDFLVYLGDNVVLGGLRPLLDDFRRHRPDATVMVARTPEPSRFGVAEVDGSGVVTGLEEKPRAPRSDLALVGAYVFSPAIHQGVLATRPNWRNERELTDAIRWMSAHGHCIRAHRYHGYWKDTGRPEDLLDCNRAVLETLEPAVEGTVDAHSELIGPVHVEEGARVRRSRIEGPAIIGFDATVEASTIGRHTAVGAACTIVDAGVERSVLLDGATLRGVHIHDSIVGKDADIRRAPAAAECRQLVVGDHSRLLIGSPEAPFHAVPVP